MGSLANMVEGDRKGLPHEVTGLPALNLDTMQGAEIPAEYDITKVLGDTLMCEIIDEAKNGEVLRGGIYINQDITKKIWRVGKVIMLGPQCSGVVGKGDLVMYPNDRGIPMINMGKKFIFLNEERIFCVCKEKK
jgi:co-chaperonin GroES (HSP10)